MITTRSIAMLTCLWVASGCAEAANDEPEPTSTTGSTSTSTSSGAGGETATTTGGGGGTAGGTPTQVTVNEISAAGDDWVELFNAGTGPADLSGWGLCDTAGDGTPKLDEAVRFAAGEILPAGGFLVIVGDQADAGAGPQTNCLGGAVAKCYLAGWAISASNGETVYLVDADDGVSAKAAYPPNAVPDGQTWARIPDGTGDFVAGKPTPAKANQEP